MAEASAPVNHEDDSNEENISTPAPDSTISVADESESLIGQRDENGPDEADLHGSYQDASDLVEQNGVASSSAAENEDSSLSHIGNAMAVVPVIAPIMTYQVYPQDPSPSCLANMLINSFKQMTLQMTELTETSRQISDRTEELGRGQIQMLDELAELRAAQQRTQEEISRTIEELRNLEQSVNQISQSTREYFQEMNRRLEEEERGEQAGAIANGQPGQANVLGWRRVMQKFIEMIPFQQFLVVVGVVAVSWLSHRFAIWGYPYIVEAVCIVSVQFTNLMETAAVFLRNVNWNEYINRFANMGGVNGHSFEELMNDPLTQTLNAGLFGRTLLVFIVTLLEILRSQAVENYKV